MIKKILKLSILTALSLFVAIQSNTQTVQAAFNKDNLIGDGIFDDSASMNASQIDSFLNSQNSCISPNSGFLAIEPIGYNPTDGFIYGGNVSAGTVIARAAQVYGLNPKVIIATLQKEQSLITSSPTSSNCNTRTISKSMGYACTDTYSPHAYYDLNLYTRNGITYTSVDLTCVESAKKAGFTQQVIRAAWMLKYTQQRSLGNIKWAVISGSWDNSDDLNACYSGPVTEGWRQVCPSGKTVYYDGLMTIDGITIHPNSGATVALYRYTPHFSGNKNFVAIYEGWFGPTQPDVSITSPLRIESIREGYFTNQEIALSFDIVNTASWPMGVGDMMIATRDSKGQNYDFGLQRIVLNPKSSYNYRAKIILPAEETYTFSIANNHDGTWNGDYPQSSYIGNARSVQRFVQAMPTITKSPNLDSAARVGRLMRANFAVKNNSALPLNLGKIGLAMRDASGNNRDLPYEVAGSLAAGQIYEYNEFFAPDKVSHYSASVSVTLDNGATWDNGTFPTSSPSTSRFLDFDVLPNPTLTAGITSSNTALRAGQQTTLTFKVTNFGSQPIDIGKIGMALRSPDGQNYDPRWDSIILQPSQVYTHSVDVVLPKAGEWNIAIGNYNNTMGWNSTYPVSENQDIVRSVKLQVQ